MYKILQNSRNIYVASLQASHKNRLNRLVNKQLFGKRYFKIFI